MRNDGGLIELMLSMVVNSCDDGKLSAPVFVAILIRIEVDVELMMSVGVTTVNESVS